jgi:hypothetical protein
MSAEPGVTAGRGSRRLGMALLVIAAAQLMVVIDSTTTGFLSLTAPKAQAALRASH